MVAKVIEGTILLVAVYLVITNSFGFSEVIRAVGSTYSGAVRTLQGNA